MSIYSEILSEFDQSEKKSTTALSLPGFKIDKNLNNDKSSLNNAQMN